LLKEVVDAMYSREVKVKEVLIKEGEKGSHMFVSAAGRFEVSVKGKGVVNVFEDVRIFGEMAILYNAKRNATIKAVKPGRVWVLDRSAYQQLTVTSTIKEHDEMLEFLKNVPQTEQNRRESFTQSGDFAQGQVLLAWYRDRQTGGPRRQILHNQSRKCHHH
jgi:cGMP-dependent protein kinase